jgi:hypothetical protein
MKGKKCVGWVLAKVSGNKNVQPVERTTKQGDTTTLFLNTHFQKFL